LLSTAAAKPPSLSSLASSSGEVAERIRAAYPDARVVLMSATERHDAVVPKTSLTPRTLATVVDIN
jgi:hypothetical protein